MFDGDSFWLRTSFMWCAAASKTLDTAAMAAGGPIAASTLLRGRNPPSKTDRSGRKYGGKWMYFLKDDANPINFAAEWERWELKYPRPPGGAHQWPAFSPTGDARPFRERQARRVLHKLMVHTLGAEAAAEHAWHDFRATSH